MIYVPVSPLDYYIDVTPFAVGGPYQVQLTMNVDDEVRGNLGVATIGPSVEYPNGWNGYFSVDLKLRKMTITYLVGVGYGGSSPDDSATTIYLNWNGLTFQQGETIIIGW